MKPKKTIVLLFCQMAALIGSAAADTAHSFAPAPARQPLFVIECWKLPYAEHAAMLKELGYDGACADNYLSHRRDIRALLKELHARDLKLYSAYLTLDFDAATNALTEPLRRFIDDLQGSGAVLSIAIRSVTQDGKAFAHSSPDGDKVALARLREIADYAGPRGVKIALYPHVSFWAERFGDSLRLANKMDRPDVGAIFNLCHWLKVEGDIDPLPALKAALPRLFFVSINGADKGDTRKHDWDQLVQPLGEGSYDVAGFVSQLRAIGYAGPVGFQTYNIKGKPGDILARSMAAWRKFGAQPRGHVGMDAAGKLEQSFRHPPESAKPWTWWHWMNGNVTKAGITADLEAMKRVGIGGLFIFHVGTVKFPGDVKFFSPEWWALMRHAAEEADRLELQIGFHNCPGWSSSGGPWVKVEDSMQKLVWSELKFTGPGRIEKALERPPVDSKWNYYRDIAVIALPDDSTNSVSEKSVFDLTAKMGAQGMLAWDAPEGNWVIFRFGHTTTGKENHPAPTGGAGLEVDKMSKEAIEAHFRDYPAKIIANAGAAGRALTTIEIDSYEVGKQDWTPAYREEFKQRRGYDPLPWLPAWAKRSIGSDAQSERFRWDMNRTIADLFADNYYGHFGKLVREHPGMHFTLEPYSGPFDDLTVGGRADVVMGEFWQKPCVWGWDSLRRVASIAHTLGKPIVAAEALTGQPQFAQWRQDPYALKASGDKAFCLGVNRLVLHTYAHQPWPERVKPGMTMGWWGTHFSRTQTWWEQSRAWFDYLKRCQFLLQQGVFVGDILYLDDKKIDPPQGYAGDAISEEVFLRDLAVADGKLVLPHGISYRVLVLPKRDTMTPAVARKVEQLAAGGAVILGPKPTHSPSLESYPASEIEVRNIAEELWNNGKVISDKSLKDVLANFGVKPDFQTPETEAGWFARPTQWIHRRTSEADIYFISNQEEKDRIVECAFRVSGKQPELWDAATGEIRDAGTFQMADGVTRLPLKLDPSGSVFVVFRRDIPATQSAEKPNWSEFSPIQEIAGAWAVRFDPKWGGPGKVEFDKLEDWSKRAEKGIRYYSGTAVYEKSFKLAREDARKSLWLDLGEVKNLAEVELNGKSLGVLWKPPFRVEISKAVKRGSNRLVVKVTNLWPNRLIGDEQEPEDMEWGKEERPRWANGYTGKPLQTLPEWFVQGKLRPSPGRLMFTSWKFYEKDSPLLPSGLLGPVGIVAESKQ